MYLYKLVFFFFFQICTWEWNYWMIWQFWFYFFKKPPNCFPQWLHQFTFSSAVYKVSLFFASYLKFVIYILCDDSHSDKVRCYLIVALICISLTITYVEQLFMCLWPSVCLLWKNVYSSSLLSFQLHFFLFDVQLYDLSIYFGCQHLIDLDVSTISFEIFFFSFFKLFLFC